MSDERVEVIDLSDTSTSLSVALTEALELETEPSDGGGDVNENDEEEQEQAKTEEPEEDTEETTEKPSKSDNTTEKRGLSGLSKGGPEQVSQFESKTDEPVERQTLFFFQIDNKTVSTPFIPEDPEKQDRGFPIEASGQVDSIFILSQSNSFKATLQIDGDKIIDNESWSTLQTMSAELAHIGAYQATGSNKYVLSISDYTFNDKIDLSIRPEQEIQFDTIRVELMVDEYKTGV